MKSIKAISCLSFFLLFMLTFSALGSDNNEPELIDKSINLYKAGNIYLAGQPGKEKFQELTEKNVTLVINLRTDPEMETFYKEEFNEESFLENDLNIKYIHIPVGGSSGYSVDITNSVGKAIEEANGDVLIHCRSAGRATLVWMAWLVNYEKMDINEAFRMGKMARFTFPIEDLIGADIKMKKPKK